MSKTIRLSKGLNIKLKGEAEKAYAPGFKTDKYAIKPTDFNGLFPKLLVQPGDKVKAGTPIMFDKYKEKVVFSYFGVITNLISAIKIIHSPEPRF